MSSSEEEDAKKELRTFIMNVKDDLDKVTANIDLFVQDEQLRSKIKEAWKKVEPKFERMQPYIDKASLEDLQERGLAGPELKLKLLLYERLRKEFHERFNEFPIGLFWWTHLGRGILGKLWDMIDSILRSLGFPGADAIGEFKEAVEAASGD